MDSDGYPLPETLARLADWQINSYEDCEDLLAWLQTIWKWNDYIKPAKRRQRSSKGGRLYRTWYVSTGGWSGHEEIIGILQENYVFWGFAWYSSRRGGHYEFRV